MTKYGAQVRLANTELTDYIEVAKGNLAYELKQYGLTDPSQVEYAIVNGIGYDPETGEQYPTKELHAVWDSNGQSEVQ